MKAKIVPPVPEGTITLKQFMTEHPLVRIAFAGGSWTDRMGLVPLPMIVLMVSQHTITAEGSPKGVVNFMITVEVPSLEERAMRRYDQPGPKHDNPRIEKKLAQKHGGSHWVPVTEVQHILIPIEVAYKLMKVHVGNPALLPKGSPVGIHVTLKDVEAWTGASPFIIDYVRTT